MTVQGLPVTGLFREDVAVKATVINETSASKFELIVNCLVAAVQVSHEGYVITTPAFL